MSSLSHYSLQVSGVVRLPGPVVIEPEREGDNGQQPDAEIIQK